MTDTKPPRLNPEAQKAHDEAKAKHRETETVVRSFSELHEPQPELVRESGSSMTKAHALGLYVGSVPWLRHQIASGTRCSCGHCHLCGYNYLLQHCT